MNGPANRNRLAVGAVAAVAVLLSGAVGCNNDCSLRISTESRLPTGAVGAAYFFPLRETGVRSHKRKLLKAAGEPAGSVESWRRERTHGRRPHIMAVGRTSWPLHASCGRRQPAHQP